MKGKCYPAYSLEKDKLKKVVIYRNRKQWNYQENLQHDHLCLSYTQRFLKQKTLRVATKKVLKEKWITCQQSGWQKPEETSNT